jgi:hypothetical protein
MEAMHVLSPKASERNVAEGERDEGAARLAGESSSRLAGETS